MVECYFQQGSNSTLSKKQCATNEACHLTYIIHIDNVDINDSYNIKDDKQLNPFQADCISLENRQECTEYQDECGHYYTHSRNASGNGYEWGHYTIYCCCTSPLCNNYTKANLRSCTADECQSKNQTILSDSCFCDDFIRDEDLPNSPLSKQKSLDALIIHYISVFLLLVLFCSIGTVILRKVYRKWHQKRTSTASNASLEIDESGVQANRFDMMLRPSHYNAPITEDKLKEYKYAHGGPNNKSILGNGRYGRVHLVEKSTGDLFAMKIFMFQGQHHNPDDPMIRAMWQKEYQHLNKCIHPNIVRRDAAGRFKYGSLQCFSIVLEYCKLGSLSTWLNECAREQRAVPLLNAVKIGKDLAAALEFLHEPSRDSGRYVRIPVAHRDVKSTNILLRSDSHALLSDFGLAITLESLVKKEDIVDMGNSKPDIDYYRLKQCGTPRYLAPELLEGPMDVYNFANAFRQADVYSMSLVHWELFRMVKELNKGYHFTHELPYQKELAGCRATVSSLLRIVAQSGQRPIIASSFEDTPFGLVLQRIFTESWDSDPAARVTSATVHMRLEELLDKCKPFATQKL